jgi:hypothetical protein
MPIDYSAAPPVKRGTSAATRKPAAPKVDVKALKYQDTLESLRDVAVTVTMFAGLDADCAAIQLHTPGMIPVYAKAASDNEGFGKFLDTFDQVGGKWLELAMVTLPLVMQFAANHSWMKPSPMFNVQPPEVLRAQVMSQRAEVMRNAQETLAASQAEMDALVREKGTAAA